MQPFHRQVARQILWWKSRYPGVPVWLAKRDVNGAFRLVWLAPGDVETFSTTLPWSPQAMVPEGGKVTAQVAAGAKLLLFYLVLSFGWSGSPGEWTAWALAIIQFMEHFRLQGVP